MKPSDKILDGRFRRINLLGEGGMSKVFLAEHVLLEKRVAIKMVYPGDETAIARLRREAIICAGLNHENINNVHDLGTTADGALCVVMDYIEGKDLKAAVADKTFMTDERLFDVLIQVAHGLKYLHSQRIIHRDLKPQNIIIATTDDGSPHAKLIDFGIAKEENEDGAVQALTRTGKMAGSPHYMAPEQCQSGKLDQRVDIYALGCVIYELLAGRPPFRGSTVLDTLKMHIENNVTTDNITRTQLSDALLPVALKCLEKDPDLRYQSAEELIQALEASRKKFQGVEVKAVLDSRRRNLQMLIGAAVLICITFFGTRFLQEKHDRDSFVAEKNALISSLILIGKASILESLSLDSETRASYDAALKLKDLPDLAACEVGTDYIGYLRRMKNPGWPGEVEKVYDQLAPRLERLSDTRNIDKSVGIGNLPAFYMLTSEAMDQTGNVNKAFKRINTAIDLTKKFSDANWLTPTLKLERAGLYLEADNPERAVFDLNGCRHDLETVHRGQLYSPEGTSVTGLGLNSLLLHEAYLRQNEKKSAAEIDDELKQGASKSNQGSRSQAVLADYRKKIKEHTSVKPNVHLD